eukprot:220857-Rhodomonas_salina.2
MPPASCNAFQLCTSLKPLLSAALFLSDSVVKEQELCIQVYTAYLHKFTVNSENLNLTFQAVKEHLQELHVSHILFPKRGKAVIDSARCSTSSSAGRPGMIRSTGGHRAEAVSCRLAGGVSAPLHVKGGA